MMAIDRSRLPLLCHRCESALHTLASDDGGSVETSPRSREQPAYIERAVSASCLYAGYASVARRRRAVELIDIVEQHPARRELRRDCAHCLFADPHVASRHAGAVALVIRGNNAVLNQVVHFGRLFGVAKLSEMNRWLDPPTVFALGGPGFAPPTIENAEIRHAIDSGFHAAGAARFERRAR